jgi:hypothetical protein
LGAEVDVFMRGSGSYPPLGYNLKTNPFPIRLRKWYGGIQKSLGNWQRWACGLKAHHRLKSQRYDLVFGIDAEGVVAAFDYHKTWNGPFIYLSYEIVFRDELHDKARLRLKREEIEASRFANLVIAQDPRRGYLLSRENDLGKKRMFWLPVSPKIHDIGGKSDYLRRLYGIPESKKIILHSGSFEEWTYAEELLQNARDWHDNVVLVIHCRQKKQKLRYALKKGEKSNVIFSSTPLEKRTYEQMVSSADIGLCLYKEIPEHPFLQKNIRHIGLASGKFAYYAKYGLPVISLKCATYARIQRQYHFGEDLEQFSEMPNAIHRILEQYDSYSKESKRLFREKLAFDLYRPALTEKIHHLLASL